jgi:hypothetical protein
MQRHSLSLLGLCLALAVPLVGLAQTTPPSATAAGGASPVNILQQQGVQPALTVKDLGPEWFTFTPSAAAQEDGTPQSYVSRGKIATLGTRQYLIVYSIPPTGVMIDPANKEQVIAAPVTESTRLIATLLDLATLGNLENVAPYSPAWLTTANTPPVTTTLTAQLRRQMQETTLRANLQRLRHAIACFQADTGIYPVSLTDVIVPATAGATVGTSTVPYNAYKGPYLLLQGGINGNGLPSNPLTAAGDLDITHHWLYDPHDGNVVSAVEGKTLDGVDYTKL